MAQAPVLCGNGGIMKRTLKTTVVASAILALTSAGLGAPAAQADDMRRTGSYTVRAGQTVDDNLIVANGTLRIYGKVDGNVRQVGKGSVIVYSGGKVDGNIEEQSSGGVIVRKGGYVDGNIKETGSGKVVIAGTVDGNVQERGKGKLLVRKTARIDGNVSERGAGKLVVKKGARIDRDDD